MGLIHSCSWLSSVSVRLWKSPKHCDSGEVDGISRLAFEGKDDGWRDDILNLLGGGPSEGWQACLIAV